MRDLDCPVCAPELHPPDCRTPNHHTCQEHTMTGTVRATTVYTLRAATSGDSTREVNEATARLYNAASAVLDRAGVSDSYGSTSGWEFSPNAVLPYASVSFRLLTSDDAALALAARVRAEAGHTGPWVLTTGLGIHQRTIGQTVGA